jgi:hypothetical protein
MFVHLGTTVITVASVIARGGGANFARETESSLKKKRSRSKLCGLNSVA